MTTDLKSLASEELVDIDNDTRPLRTQELDDLKKALFSWGVVEKDGTERLYNAYRFANTRDAEQFIEQVKERADACKCEPQVSVDDTLVTVEWRTHELDGLHRNDFIMAAKTQEVYEHWQELSGDKDKVDIESEESFPASDAPGNY
jgi:4a-hydroxytetrahydrobiopterin dehydratase